MRILLVVYDNDSYVHWFPQGLGYIAAVLRREGHEVAIYNQDVHHYPDERLTAFLDRERFDVVGVSVIAGYYQYRKLLALSDAINRSRQRPTYIIGGHGPSPEPEYFLRKTGADLAVIGEGEMTIVDALDALAAARPLREVAGIAFMEGDRLVETPPRPLVQNIDELPWPAYDLFPVDVYRLLRMPHADNRDFVMPVLSGRGCTFKCTFCYRLDKGFRARSDDAIIEEIRYLKTSYGISYVAFSDELLMSSKERTVALCEALIRSGLNVKWDCNGRLNHATPEVLELMRRAGCVFINYGIEAMDDEVLKKMKKGLRVEQVYKGVDATLKAGMSPGLNIIFGNIGDSRETLQKAVDFLLEYDDGAQMRTIRPVTPYPGSPLYYTAKERGLIDDCEDFYERKHLNSDLLAVNFTEMSDDEVHMALYEANSVLIQNHFRKKAERVVRQAHELYMGRNATFRGFRQS